MRRSLRPAGGCTRLLAGVFGSVLLAVSALARDIVVHAGALLADPAQLRHVDFVMEGGVVYRRDGKPTVATAE